MGCNVSIKIDRFKKAPNLLDAVAKGVEVSKKHHPDRAVSLIYDHVRAVAALHFAEVKAGQRWPIQKVLLRLWKGLTEIPDSPTRPARAEIHFSEGEDDADV